jgi:hypothetical protein
VDKPCGVVSLSSELVGHAEVLLIRDATRGQYDAVGNGWYGQLASVNMIELGWWLRGDSTPQSLLRTNALSSSVRSTSNTNYERDDTATRAVGGHGGKRAGSMSQTVAAMTHSAVDEWRNLVVRGAAASTASTAAVSAAAGGGGGYIRSLVLHDLMVGLGQDSAAAALAPLQYPTPSAEEILSFPGITPVPLTAGAVGALVVVSCSSDWRNAGEAHLDVINTLRSLVV